MSAFEGTYTCPQETPAITAIAVVNFVTAGLGPGTTILEQSVFGTQADECQLVSGLQDYTITQALSTTTVCTSQPCTSKGCHVIQHIPFEGCSACVCKETADITCKY